MKRVPLIIRIVLLATVLTGCVFPAAQTTATVVPTAAPTTAEIPSLVPTASLEPRPTATLAPSATPAPTLTPTPAIEGPDSYQPGVNPLTGLSVTQSANLQIPPALVSVSNFPVTTRPQAGLSYAPWVFEFYTGEGMTRFLAVMYGDLPDTAPDESTAGFAPTDMGSVGPIRSGRLPYEDIRKLFGGFILMASGYEGVVKELSNYTNVYGSVNDVNSVFVNVGQIQRIGESYRQLLGSPQFSGLLFDPTAPAAGRPANALWVPYSYANQVIWRYDAASGAYLRWQDQNDGATFVQCTDRLNGQALAFENVIVLFADHIVTSSSIIDVNTLYVKTGKALLFRDGVMQEINWSTLDKAYYEETGHMRLFQFTDAEGNTVALKPGQTWVQVVTPYSNYYETVDSELYPEKNAETPGSGYWAVRFAKPY